MCREHQIQHVGYGQNARVHAHSQSARVRTLQVVVQLLTLTPFWEKLEFVL